ncbi:unnamed protein product, partial [Polarella glacialis]
DAWQMADANGEGGLLDRAWRGEDSMDELWANANHQAAEYKFAEDNPFMDSQDPLAEAQRLLREGRDREALLALEAEVQRNPESSEGWRLLGQLYAEMDQDVQAIQCLQKGHEVDPYNLASLLALGVSCTNEFDQLPALRYLRKWIENHEEHQALVEGLEMPPEFEYDAWRRQVTELFSRAAQVNPMDSDVFVALGVMENINKNYDGAIEALATACRLRPNDHTVWNKLGATLANSGKSEQAVVHHLALQANWRTTGGHVRQYRRTGSGMTFSKSGRGLALGAAVPKSAKSQNAKLQCATVVFHKTFIRGNDVKGLVHALSTYEIPKHLPLRQSLRPHSTMPFGDKKKTAEKKVKDGKGSGKGQKYVKAVPLFKLFLKWGLRSYANKDGCMLFTDSGEPSKYFTVKSVRDMLTEDSSECVRRPATGVNLAAGTIEGGLDVLACFPEDGKADGGTAEKHYIDTGIPDCKALLDADFRTLVEALNVTNQLCGDKKVCQQNAKQLLQLMGRLTGWTLVGTVPPLLTRLFWGWGTAPRGLCQTTRGSQGIGGGIASWGYRSARTLSDHWR